MSKSKAISISHNPLFQANTRSMARDKSDPIFDTLRKFGLNSGMVRQLEIYNEVGGGLPIPMFEEIVGNWLTCKAEVTLQALARKHGAEYKSLHDEFVAVAW